MIRRDLTGSGQYLRFLFTSNVWTRDCKLLPAHQIQPIEHVCALETKGIGWLLTTV